MFIWFYLLLLHLFVCFLPLKGPLYGRNVVDMFLLPEIKSFISVNATDLLLLLRLGVISFSLFLLHARKER